MLVGMILIGGAMAADSGRGLMSAMLNSNAAPLASS